MQPLLLTIVTLNVLQTGHQAELRYPAIESALQALSPDIVTLQEVRRLGPDRTSADTLLDGYHRAVDGRYRGYHLAILSRYPIKRTVRVPFRTNRARMAFGAVLDVGGTEVLVLTTHLDYQLRHHRQRRAQLTQLFAAAADFTGPAIVTGDLNFGDGAPESDAIPPSWTDAWRACHPTAPGFTWDNDKNPMARRGRLRGEPSRRLDRVIVRQMDTEESRLVLTAPIRPGLWASDHFGLFARLAVR